MSQVRVILQARTSSSRLPGKSLLPIGGIPAAVLAALRVHSPRWQVVLATSIDRSDDPLAQAAEAFSIRHVRGSLQDVLSRFVMAAEGLDDDAVIVRLTADNLFPDAELVHEVLQEFGRRGCGYLFTWSPSLDVPYGLSVEVFKVAALREAATDVYSRFDREHVTPWIYRTYGRQVYRPRDLPTGYGRLRCTIDTLDDYVRVAGVFARAANPMTVPWLDLCRRLDQDPTTPGCTVPSRQVGGVLHGALVLGTAQLGMAYGIANRTGEPTSEQAVHIVRKAVAYGVTHIDTARAYGRSESRIGVAIAQGGVADVHVVTKLRPLDDIDDDTSATCIRSLVDASVFRSCRELRQSTIPTLLLHRTRDRARWGGAAWQRLKELQDEGVIGTLGVSAETPNEVLEALADPQVGHVQFPFNILDWRWKERGIEEALAQRDDVVVHVRSALLQGLLVNTDPALWVDVAPGHADAILRSLYEIRSACDRASLLDLALAYVRSHSWVHGAVVGVEHVDQLDEIVRLFAKPPLTKAQIALAERLRVRVPEWLLSPKLWRK